MAMRAEGTRIVETPLPSGLSGGGEVINCGVRRANSTIKTYSSGADHPINFDFMATPNPKIQA